MISNVAQHKSKNGVLAPYWDSALIEKSASGSVASFSDGADGMPMVSVVADIDAVQDLHGQSSPYPSGGGKNLFNSSLLADAGTGAKYITLNLEPNTAYTMSSNDPCKDGGDITDLFFCNMDESVSSSTNGVKLGKSITRTSDANGQLRVGYRVYEGWITPTQLMAYETQIEVGSTASAYHPYSNICPISGCDEVNVTRTGKNLYNASLYPFVDGKIIRPDTGLFSGSTGFAATEVFMPCDYLQGETVTLNKRPGGNNVGIAFYTDDVYTAYISGLQNNNVTAGTPWTFTVPQTANYMRFTVQSGATEIQIEQGSTATAYEPYNGQTYPTTLPQTVYGGTLDLVSGVLTIDRIKRRIISTDSFSFLSGSGFYQFTYYFDSNTYKIGSSQNALCNIFPKITLADRGTISGLVSYSGDSGYRFALKSDMGITTVEEFKTWLQSNELEVTAELLTPQTIQLTPTEVDSLLADNNVWADSGNISVVYRADSTLAYNQLTNAIVSLGGNI